MGMRAQPQARPGSFAKGFSVLEVVFVVAVLAIMLGLAFPVWDGFIRDRNVMRAADDVASLLRFAQQAAVADSVDACGYQGVVLSTRAEVVKVARDASTGACASPAVLTPVRAIDTFPSGVTATPVTLQFSSAGGLPSCGGPGLTITVSSGSRTRAITVEPCTGRVEVAP